MNKLQNSKYSEIDKRKAAYALNMCTVSVSQIIDYNDYYILEKEYDAILNNLDLEQIPKDESLLTILTELLNVITFFRIQEEKKKQIEEEYQYRLKNSIWSAIPNFGVIAAGGNLASLALSLASQVGIGYMNYRREKANILFDKDKNDMELQLTALEQFNAIKRELFTTSWRLAKEYSFPDEYRLTERQISQYNTILMDNDEIRKLERLESIKDKFEAYPPFWYFIGHTANYIANNDELIKGNREAKNFYINKALTYFEKYEKEIEFLSILREDQISSSFALEYADLLIAQGCNYDKEKVDKLLNTAVRKCGNASDILQLCALGYLKTGNIKAAKNLLKILVNEGYDPITNSKLLSRLYVIQYFENPIETIRTEYELLASRVDPVYLFPMPEKGTVKDKDLETDYMIKQIANLKQEYRNAINEFVAKNIVEYNKICIKLGNEDYPNDFYTDKPSSKKQRCNYMKDVLSHPRFIDELSKLNFQKAYIDLLNRMLCSLGKINIFDEKIGKNTFAAMITAKLGTYKDELNRIQKNINEKHFELSDYEKIQNELSLFNAISDFVDRFKSKTMERLNKIETLSELNSMEVRLIAFCDEQGIPFDKISWKNSKNVNTLKETIHSSYIPYTLLGIDDSLEDEIEKINRMKSLAREMSNEIVVGENVKFAIQGDSHFHDFFANSALDKDINQDAIIAIIDDITSHDIDLLLTVNGFAIVKKNKIWDIRDYKRIEYVKTGNKEKFTIGWPDIYSNKSVNLARLYELVSKFKDIQDQYEK